MVVDGLVFPEFSLSRLLGTVFGPRRGERVAVLVDLEDPMDVVGGRFLGDGSLSVQRLGYEVFYCGLRDGVLDEFGWLDGGFFAYRVTGGSNLDLPDGVVGWDGVECGFVEGVFGCCDVVLCVSSFSATAPLTAAAKRFGFRGATLHGLNEVVLGSGLAVDYEEVSRQAERMRGALSGADGFEVDFVLDGGEVLELWVDCGGQVAQKSHGLCRGPEPDVANLPAGEVYFVPVGAEGAFPLRYEDGTVGRMEVRGGRIVGVSLVSGSGEVVEAHGERLRADPLTGVIGELGFGTQVLPVSGRDIQDEKILGTMHVATGRSDHLGGDLSPDCFVSPGNATHDDVLFSPSKTPGIVVREVRMRRRGSVTGVLAGFEPTGFLRGVLGG